MPFDSEYNVPNISRLTEAIRDSLEAETGKRVGISTAPLQADGTAVEPPYMVLFQAPNSRYYGTMKHPQADARVAYIIHSVGLRYDQANGMRDNMVDAMVGRDDDGNYVMSISPTGLTVALREIGESSGHQRNEGKIYTVVDTFLVSVTTS
jgi:hypothetical protein